VPIPAGRAGYLIATAARAPSVQNTQPWRFRAGEYAIELYADPGRKLRVDPASREMLISCGAALYGLALRSLGYPPVVELLPDPARRRLLARVTLGQAEPMTAWGAPAAGGAAAPPHPPRPSEAGALPAGLAAGLQHDALAEGAQLALIDRRSPLPSWRASPARSATAKIVTRWPGTRCGAGAAAPATALPPTPSPSALNASPAGSRSVTSTWAAAWGCCPAAGHHPPSPRSCSPPATARADWLRVGEALCRLLAHAASQWAFASLYTQPLDSEPIRALIRDRLALPGFPQMLLQLGRAHITRATARRQPAALTEP
jgi:hypothetical protein